MSDASACACVQQVTHGALADEGHVDINKVKEVISKYEMDPEKPSPTTV